MALLNRQDIETALRRLGALAASEGESVRAVIVGGAAMVLGYDARTATRDVDGVLVEPPLRALTSGSRDQVWHRVVAFLTPGRELKTKYAFENLWEEIARDEP